MKLFEGSAAEASKDPSERQRRGGALLAGVGQDKTLLTVSADPHLDRNCHDIEVQLEAASLMFSIANVSYEDTPHGPHHTVERRRSVGQAHQRAEVRDVAQLGPGQPAAAATRWMIMPEP